MKVTRAGESNYPFLKYERTGSLLILYKGGPYKLHITQRSSSANNPKGNPWRGMKHTSNQNLETQPRGPRKRIGALSTGGCYRGPTLGHQRSQTRSPQGHRRRAKRLVSRGRSELPVLPRSGTTLRQCPRNGVLCHALGQHVQADGHGRQGQALRHNRMR
jgi:hypothetical protein